MFYFYTQRMRLRVQGCLDIYLVHGFRGAKYSYYRDILENWVFSSFSSAAEPGNTTITGHIFRFDGSSIPDTGKYILEDAASKLRQQLIELVLEKKQRLSTHEDMLDQEHENAPSLRHDTISANSSALQGNTLLFITHSLGHWVVKDALAHPSSDLVTYSYGRNGLRFINLDIREGPGDAYGQYLERNWKQFLGQPNPHQGRNLDELVSYLREVDENFNELIMIYETQDNGNEHIDISTTPTMIYQGRDFKPIPTKRSSILLFKRKIDLSREEVIRRLSTIQGEMQHLISNPVAADLSEASAPLQEPGMLCTPGLVAMATNPREESSLPSIVTAESIANVVPRSISQTGIEMGNRVDHLTDDDSTPAVPDPNKKTGMSETDKPSVYEQANFLLQIGELKNAEQLFTRLAENSNFRGQSPVKLHIDMQIATVKMYRGDYVHSRQILLDINKRLENCRKADDSDQWMVELQNRCRQQLANCQLLAGQWAEAAKEIQSLLDENPQRYNARLRRDLAVAYAYLGRYSEARESLRLAQERMKMADLAKGIAKGKTRGRSGRKQGRELQTKEATMNMAIATVETLAGDYTTALKSSSDALDLMKKMLGAKHFRTLAIATLKAWCLAYNGKYIEAETLCLNTYKATTRSLGRFHPQSLAAMGCLVHILQCQGRFAEAIGTGLSLDSLATEWMKRPGHIHPQAVHSEFLLATAFLASGDYATSKLTIDKVVAHQAELPLGVNSPEILRYKTEQARASLYLGNVSEAQGLACLVAAKQFELYARSHDITDHGTIELSKAMEVGPLEKPLPRLNNLLTRMLETPISPLPLHPFLVSTLQLLANIEVRKYRLAGRKRHSADLATARAILETLHNYYATTKSRPIVSASSIALDLATLYKEDMSHPNDLSRAVELFTQAYEDKKSYMGENIDTLCALRELTIAQCLLDISTPDGPIHTVKAVSHTILKTLESRLGLTHPETLTSQLWFLTVDHLLPDDDSSSRDKVVKDLIKNLSDPRTVKERPIESLVMKRQLASILKASGSCEIAMVLVEDAISKLDEATFSSEHSLSRETVRELRTTFVELIETAEGGHIGR
ncbi:hypothetical protein F5Y01DRAFT_302389 [Xylaria sp. FL0043]|nr:hypothetical protein F5Y01DRAFT_302389 [Xylaria sp. FL0043]